MEKGKKLYDIGRGLARAPITAVFAFSASVMMCTYMLIYPY
jgi:hypothetical protein